MAYPSADPEVLADLNSVVNDVLAKSAATWTDIINAELPQLVIPESAGGYGLGITELAGVITNLGHAAVQLPLVENLAAGLLVLVRAGAAADLVAAVVAGEAQLTQAITESDVFELPKTKISHARLSGSKRNVTAFTGAGYLMVTCLDEANTPQVVLVDKDAAGVNLTEVKNSSGGKEWAVTFAEVADFNLLPNSYHLLIRHYLVGHLTRGAALLQGAQNLTAEYIKLRTQFGRSLAEFQAVSNEIADVYIAARTTGLLAKNLVGQLAVEGSDCAAITTDEKIASFWFCKYAPAALQTCHHLHGGMGVDETYPLHHFFSQIRDITRYLGGSFATKQQLPSVDPELKNPELSPEQRAFKAEVRQYFEGLSTRDDRVEVMTDRHGPAYHRTIKQMGADGWMGVGWPTEYGGKAMGEIEQTIFANEASRNDIHLPAVTLQTVGPTLQRFGTEEQKQKFLAPILAGDIHFAIGYSEPDAGTDLASLRCSAKKVGDEYIVNGQKMWTTGGHAADYIWLAVRTDPDAPKHKGISVLIVDTKDPGYSWTPIITCDGSHHVNATYFNDVRVPASMLVGGENEGWKLITTQLNHERIMLGPAGRIEGLRDMVATWAETQGVAADPGLRQILAEATAAYRVNEFMNWEVSAPSGEQNLVADASALKVFASETVQEIGLKLAETVERLGDPTDPETAFLLDYLDKTAKRNLVLTFGGGVNEVQRELIGMFGMNLPRVPR